jgi:integrase
MVNFLVSVECWLDDPQKNYAPSTRYSYRWAMNCFGRWCEREQITPENITPRQLSAWLLETAGSKNYRRLIGNAVRSYLRFTYGDHPAARIRLPNDDAPAGRTLTYTQFLQLTASFDTSTALGWRNLALVMMMVDTGLRSSEVCRLEKRRVNLWDRTLSVIAKGGDWRDGAVTEDTAYAMRTWLELRKKIAKKGEPHFFVSVGGIRPGTGLTPGGLRKLFRVWGEDAGLGPLSPHDMRRTMSVLYYEDGAPDKAIMDAGNWDDERTLHRYQRRSRIKTAVRYSPTAGMIMEMDNMIGDLKQKTPMQNRGNGS